MAIRDPQSFKETRFLSTQTAVALSGSPSQYDAKYGYTYKKNIFLYQSRAIGNRIVVCRAHIKTDEHGNPGDKEGDYASADIKILVFGDSFISYNDLTGGTTMSSVPLQLQKILEKTINKKISVVNFGRGGYGIIQMFELAADVIAVWKPDLVVFAFITDDLGRDRWYWKDDTLNVVPEIATTACDVAILSDPEKSSKLAKLIIKNYYKTTAKLKYPPSIFSSYSFMYSWLKHNDYLYNYRKEHLSGNARLTINSFTQDDAFINALNKINSYKCPYVIVHLSTVNELKEKKEYLFTKEHDRYLLESLAKITGKKIHTTMDNSFQITSTDKIDEMFLLPYDTHPAHKGMVFYGHIISNAIKKEGLLQ